MRSEPAVNKLLSMLKCLIVAAAEDGAIGLEGRMPWHIPADLKYFKSTTLGFPVIMGRRTFESLGKPLPGRKNIVLSRSGFPRAASLPGQLQAEYKADSIVGAASLEEAYRAAGDAEKCFVIGGGTVYLQAMGDADLIYLTRVHTKVEDADAFFPEIDPELWKLDSRSETLTDPASGLEFEFELYSRR